MDALIEIASVADSATYTALTMLCKYLNKHVPEDCSSFVNMRRTLGRWRLHTDNPIRDRYKDASTPEQYGVVWNRYGTDLQKPARLSLNYIDYILGDYINDMYTITYLEVTPSFTIRVYYKYIGEWLHVKELIYAM